MANTGRLHDTYTREPTPKLWEEYLTDESAFGAAFGMGYDTQGITQQVIRGHMGESEVGIAALFSKAFGFEEQKIDAETATNMGAVYGLSYDNPVRKSRLNLEINNKKKEEERKSTLARIPESWSKTGAVLSGGFAASFADPIEIASALIPVVGPARKADLAEKLSVTGGRIVTGAVEGFVGASLIEFPRYSMTQKAQLEYTMNDLMANIAFGTALGGGLHYVGGRFSDRLNRRVGGAEPATDINIPERIDRSRMETKIDALRTALSDVMEGRVLNVEPIFKLDSSYTGQYSGISRVGPQDWRAPDFSPQNQNRISTRSQSDISVAKESVFDSRSKADKYIRENSKDTLSQRTDYLVEKTDNGKYDVYKIRDTAIETGEDGSTLLFKDFVDAKKHADEQNSLLTDGALERFYTISSKKQKGRSAQEHFVIKSSKPLSDAELNNIKSTPAFFKQGIESDIDPIVSNDISKMLRDFNTEKSDPNNISAIQGVEKRLDPKNFSDEIQEIDEYSLSDAEDIGLVFSNIKKGIDDKDLLMEISEFESLIKTLDDDVKTFEKQRENIIALGKCMAG